MDPTLEIRKLGKSHISKLSDILDYDESWKRLMCIIPSTLKKNVFECDIQIENPPKYNSYHFKILINESKKPHKSCTATLFDEWGTSGRIRPALGHLMYLLVKAQLFRAADYVAVDLMNQLAPERPSTGPAAPITIDIEETELNHEEDIERLLDEIDYPSSAIEYLQQTQGQQLSPVPLEIPEIVVSEVIESSVYEVNVDYQASEVSDMMKFSGENQEGEVEIPDISQLLISGDSASGKISDEATISESTATSSTNEVIPNISVLISNNSDPIEECSSSNVDNGNIPNFSKLISPESSTDETVTDLSVSNADNLPDLSVLNPSEDNNIPNISMLQ